MLASLEKRRLTKLLEWANNRKIHGSVSSLLCPFSELPRKAKISSRTGESAVATYYSLGALRDTTTDNKAECFHSLHDPVFKSLSSAIKEAIFGKSLLVYLETIRQVAKIDHAQGQIQCSNTCTLFLCQKLFPSYFLSWQRILC